MSDLSGTTSADKAGWKECGWAGCRKRFKPSRRSNQHQHPRGQQHDAAVFCSNACRQKAYRWRLQASRYGCSGTTTHATVTRPEQHIENADKFSTKNGHARAAFQLPDGYVYSKWEPWPPAKWQPLIGPGDAPVNILGGYKFPDAPKIELTDFRDSHGIPDDLSIPEFLKVKP
jgi:hypothetical protein